MRVLGIDPGLSGACALFVADAVVPTVPAGIFDMPTLGTGKQSELDYAGLRNLIWDLQPDACFIEKITAWMPRDEETGEVKAWGATSKLKLAGAFYAAKAVVACLNVEVREVNAGAWKGVFGLKGGSENKDASRQVCLSRWPSIRPFMERKKDHNRAEAFLIGAYGAGVLTGTITRERRRPVFDDAEIPE